MAIKTLEKLIAYADLSFNQVNKELARLFDSITKGIKKSEYSFEDKYIDIIKSIKYHGMISDCADFLDAVIIDDKKSRILEFSLSNRPRDIDYLNEWIHESLNEHSLKSNSFVYIAWKNRPENYYYVGKGKTSTRMNLTTHGNLLESLKQASYFAMLFPNSSKQHIISNLEASLINLIEYKTGELPKYNKRKERFTFSDLECDNKISSIHELLSDLSSEFS